MKKILEKLSSWVVTLVVVCAVFLMGSRLLGFQVYNVVSGSMEPTYSVGDLLYVKDVDPDAIRVGDPITFVLNEDLVVATHRVIKIDAEKRLFYTKGDANDTADAAPVHFNNLIGVPKFSIPLLGYVSEFIQNPPGMYIALVLGISLLAVVFLPDILRKVKGSASDPAAQSAPSVNNTQAATVSESVPTAPAVDAPPTNVPELQSKEVQNGE